MKNGIESRSGMALMARKWRQRNNGAQQRNGEIMAARNISGNGAPRREMAAAASAKNKAISNISWRARQHRRENISAAWRHQHHQRRVNVAA